MGGQLTRPPSLRQPGRRRRTARRHPLPGSAAALHVVDARAAPAAEPADPAAGLGTTAVNTFATWTSTGASGATTSASSLLAARPALDRVFLWNGIRWLLYAEVDGIPIPGSLDYLIQSSDTLWLGTAE